MKTILAILCVVCLCVCVAPVHAGALSLDNLSAGAFDVPPETAKSTPPVAAPTAATKQAADVINRKTNPVRTPQPSARAALQNTTGACANGQCGRN